MVDTARSSSGVLARKEEVGGGGGRGELHGQLGMVIGGQGVRACDACGVERARWYCAADDACLCERCDGSVHAANAVARRHERVRLGPGGAPARRRGVSAASGKENSEGDVQATVPPPSDQLHKRMSSSMGTWASRKRPRTRRHNPHRPASVPPQLLSPSSDLCVKPEPLSPRSPARDHDLYVPDHSHLLDCLFDLHDDTLLLHEVPIYTPLHFDQAPPCPPLHCAAAVNYDDDDQKPQLSPPLRYEGDDESADHLADPGLDHFFIPGNSIDIEHFLDSADISTHDPDLPAPAPNLDDPDDDHQFYRRSPLFAVRSPKSSSSRDDTYSASDPYCSIADGHSPDDAPPACAFYGDDVDVCLHGESPRSWLCKVKVESPPSLSDHDEVVLCHKLNCDFQADQKPKLGLKLDIEGVLDAWSDQGALWMDGQRPDESCLDAVAGGWVVPDLSYNYMHPRDQLGLVPSMNDSNIAAKTGAAREARVLRYKEKRRNRLFSKKIRYEVRKLNAEKRPRMKGRFVKRSAPVMD